MEIVGRQLNWRLNNLLLSLEIWAEAWAQLCRSMKSFLWFFPWFWPCNFIITIRKLSNCSCTLHWIIAISSISPFLLYFILHNFREGTLGSLSLCFPCSFQCSWLAWGRQNCAVVCCCSPRAPQEDFLGAHHHRKPWGLWVTPFAIQGCSQTFLGHETPGYIPELVTAQPEAAVGWLSAPSQLCP